MGGYRNYRPFALQFADVHDRMSRFDDAYLNLSNIGMYVISRYVAIGQ
jgi:hypothetical protein